MKRCLFCLLAVLSWLPLPAETIDSLFARVPDSELPLLELNSRLDMLDLYNYKMAAKAENVYGGSSYLLVKSDDFLRVQLTDVSIWSLKRLSVGGDTLYSCIHSVGSPAVSSRIRFYRSDWTLAAVDVPVPSFDSFWQPSDSLPAERLTELRARLSPLCMEAYWAADVPELTFRISIAALNEDDRRDARRCLLPLTYLWKEGRLVRK